MKVWGSFGHMILILELVGIGVQNYEVADGFGTQMGWDRQRGLGFGYGGGGGWLGLGYERGGRWLY